MVGVKASLDCFAFLYCFFGLRLTLANRPHLPSSANSASLANLSVWLKRSYHG